MWTRMDVNEEDRKQNSDRIQCKKMDKLETDGKEESYW